MKWDADRVDVLLRRHCHPNETPGADVCAVRLFAHRATVARWHTAQAKRVLPGEKGTFHSKDGGVLWAHDVNVEENPKAVDALSRHTVLPKRLLVWKGMQVIFRGSNPNPARGLVNCAVAIVHDFSPKDAVHPFVSVLLRRPLRRDEPTRITPWENAPISGPDGLPITCRQIPLAPGDAWTMHMGIGLTLDAVATELIGDDRTARVWERGQMYMALTRVSRLEDCWLLKYDWRLVDYLLAQTVPEMEVVEEWIQDTRLNRRVDGGARPRLDPPGMSARRQQFLVRPCRTLGGLEPPPGAVTAVFLLQQERLPHHMFWGYSEDVQTRIVQLNSNGPLASPRTRGRTDWLLAAFVSPFPIPAKALHTQSPHAIG